MTFVQTEDRGVLIREVESVKNRDPWPQAIFPAIPCTFDEISIPSVSRFKMLTRDVTHQENRLNSKLQTP